MIKPLSMRQSMDCVLRGRPQSLSVCRRRVFESNLIRFVVSPARIEAALLEAPGGGVAVAYDRVDHASRNDARDSSACSRRLSRLQRLPRPRRAASVRTGSGRRRAVCDFHPQYQFADTEANAFENYTNRSPFPMLHLLREESVSFAVADKPDDLREIPHRISNLATIVLAIALAFVFGYTPDQPAAVAGRAGPERR